MKFATGFTLVETLVAITLLLLVIVGPMTIAVNSTQGTSFSADQVVATFLAQEGIEIAQKARDDILLATFEERIAGSGATLPTPDEAWTNFASPSASTYADCFDDVAGCGLSIEQDVVGTITVTSCDSSTDACRLYEADAMVRNKYSHDASAADRSPYTRTIVMTETAGATDREVKVESRVTWRPENQITEQEVIAVTYLYNVYGF